MTHAKRIGLGALAGVVGVLAACGADGSLDAFSSGGGDAGPDPGATGSKSDAPSLAELGPTESGIILVHAARGPAYRVCFGNQPKRFPLPDAELMPEANVVGVEVGSAVRLPPLDKTSPVPGTVVIYNEASIRKFFPAGQPDTGATCETLANDTSAAESATIVGSITQDLSSGVHLLILTGCPKSTVLRPYTTEECGDDYDPSKSSLSIAVKTIAGRARPGPSTLPAEVVHLSLGVERARGEKPFSVSYGPLGPGASEHTSFADAPEYGGDPMPFVGDPELDPTDESVYARFGFRVRIQGGPTLLEQTLADVQNLSAPRDIPTTYYAAGSNYVLLLLGEPRKDEADAGDAGPVDERSALHLLAIPVVTPKTDAGADAGADGGT